MNMPSRNTEELVDNGSLIHQGNIWPSRLFSLAYRMVAYSNIITIIGKDGIGYHQVTLDQYSKEKVSMTES